MNSEIKLKIMIKQALQEKKNGNNPQSYSDLSKKKYVLSGVFWTIISVFVAFVSFLIIFTISNNIFFDVIRNVLDNPGFIFDNYIFNIVFIITESVFVLIAIAYYSYKFDREFNELRVFIRRKEYLERLEQRLDEQANKEDKENQSI